MRRRRRNPGAKAPEPKDVEIGQRIRARRLLCRLSQTALADAIGVTFQQVQKYEQGVNRVGAGRLARIAEVLSVPITFFFDGAAGRIFWRWSRSSRSALGPTEHADTDQMLLPSVD